MYVARKGLQTFEGFTKNTKVNMRNLERRDHCSVTVRDPTSLLITKMARDFTNKIMVTKCVFSKVSRGNVGNNQEGICNCIYYTLMFDL